MSSTEPHGERLQKVLSRAGVASRRQVENYLVAGRISVNGEVVTELGRRVDPARDTVALDGQVLQLEVDRRYVVFHKPAKPQIRWSRLLNCHHTFLPVSQQGSSKLRAGMMHRCPRAQASR